MSERLPEWVEKHIDGLLAEGPPVEDTDGARMRLSERAHEVFEELGRRDDHDPDVKSHMRRELHAQLAILIPNIERVITDPSSGGEDETIRKNTRTNGAPADRGVQKF